MVVSAAGTVDNQDLVAGVGCRCRCHARLREHCIMLGGQNGRWRGRGSVEWHCTELRYSSAITFEQSRWSGRALLFRIFATFVLVPKPARLSVPRLSAMDQLRTKRGFIRTVITKAISTLSTLLEDPLTPTGTLGNHLAFIEYRHAELMAFDNKIQDSL